jgi:hypothetical protein
MRYILGSYIYIYIYIHLVIMFLGIELLGQNWFNYVRQVSIMKSGFKLNYLINNEV